MNDATFSHGAFASNVGQKDGHLVVFKPRWMLELYFDLLERLRPRRIVELGVYGGGSTALLATAAMPERLAAVDIRPEPPAALLDWIAARGLGDSVSLHYGTDQADESALRRIVNDLGPLDLVIDDASHLPGPSRVSFNVLFPRLRPGGVYALEDWMGKHAWEARLGPTFEGLPAPEDVDDLLSPMVCEFVLAVAYHNFSDAIAEVKISKNLVMLTRGTADLDDSFMLERTYFSLGKAVLDGVYGPGSTRR